MSTSDRTISQVKAILGKLDRSIDQLRARRTSPAPAASLGGSNGSHAIHHVAPEPPPAPTAPIPLRAQPLRSDRPGPWSPPPSLHR